jgi:hypothetical protein
MHCRKYSRTYPLLLGNHTYVTKSGSELQVVPKDAQGDFNRFDLVEIKQGISVEENYTPLPIA